MKVGILNDTSSFHAGSAATITSLLKQLRGHDVIFRIPRLQFPSEEQIESCDVLILNGEGMFRDEEKAWEPDRIYYTFEALKTALRMGKQVHLINAVWCKMKPSWAGLLNKLNEVTVREVCSQRELAKIGVKANVYLDLSYFCPVHPREGQDNTGKVVGSFYPQNTEDRTTHLNPWFQGMPRVSLGGSIQNEKVRNWSQVIRDLSKAEIYITGQHHGVYAACKARVPFASTRINTHKLRGLFEGAGVEIPLAKNLQELQDLVFWARANPLVYEKLFDWMEKQPIWPGI